MYKINIVKSLPYQEKIDWLRLARTPKIGRSTILKLFRIFDHAQDAIENIADFAIKGGSKIPIELFSKDLAQKELEKCEKLGAQMIFLNEESYPEILRQISDPPPIITVKGNIKLMHKNILSIVGPRHASFNGCNFAKKMAYDLGQHKMVIASGMARGIDSNAHKASLETGTIAVIGGGIDNIYPRENTDLYHEIADKGLLISEQAFGNPPKGGNFVQRNRIISGLSLGVLVIEATLRSGTLTTSRFALEQNRELFAVPGSPFDPRHEGTNRLIKQGAKVTTCADDVMEDISYLIKNKKLSSSLNESFDKKFKNTQFKKPDEDILNEIRDSILKKVSYEPIPLELLIEDLSMPIKMANIALVQLELAGKIENNNGKINLMNSLDNV